MAFLSDEKWVFDPPENGPFPPLSEFLKYGSFSAIAQEIERKYYCGKHFHYPVDLMLKLVVIKFFKKIPFRKLIYSLSSDDLDLLFNPEERKKGCLLPSGKTVHHFIYYRLGEKGMTELMEKIGAELVVYIQKNYQDSAMLNLIIDSTPLEASRYSDADYSPHYEIHMSKSHIVSFCGYPLYMIYSEGLENDAPYGRELVKAITPMHPKAQYLFADGGYDNKEMYADIAQNLHAIPAIQIRNNGVIDKNAEPDSIDRLVNKLWKKGGNKSLPMDKKLEFLYNLKPDTGKNPKKYKEIVGGYYRNLSLTDILKLESLLKKRGLCERRHAQFKKVFKFDIRGLRKASRPLYTIANFISIQIMFLIHLQNGSQNTKLATYI